MKFIYCKNCNEEVALDEVLDVWYHVATDRTYCHPFGAHTEPTHAEPGNEIETEQGPKFSVCKNCKSTIVPDPHGQYKWIHDDGYYFCYPGRKGGAVPESEFRSENPVESDYGSENGSEQKMGLKNGSEIGSAQPTDTNGRGLVDQLTSLYPIIVNTVLPVHQKLKAYDAINTLLKIATQAEARIQIGESTYTQDVDDDHDEWGL